MQKIIIKEDTTYYDKLKNEYYYLCSNIDEKKNDKNKYKKDLERMKSLLNQLSSLEYTNTKKR